MRINPTPMYRLSPESARRAVEYGLRTGLIKRPESSMTDSQLETAMRKKHLDEHRAKKANRYLVNLT